MRNRLQLFIVFFAWFMTTGAQWDLAQVIAWGRMFTGYSQQMSLSAAAEKTFSGELCEFCKVVQKGRHEQDAAGTKAPDAKTPGKAVDLCPLAATTYFISPPRDEVGVVMTETAGSERDRAEPPSPPPRGVA